MKRLGFIFFIGLLLLSGMTSTLFANDKVSLLDADETVAKSERKVIMGIAEIGLQTDKFTFPVYYTPAGKNAPTFFMGEWSVRITQSEANQLLADNLPFLISSRYDKLIFYKNKVELLTATKDLTMQSQTLKMFHAPLTSYKNFKKRLLSYLNSEIAPKVEPVLSAAKDVRYHEMSNKERETFLRTKAKEVGIPASLLQSLIDSAYTFSLYMPKIEGSIFISQNRYKDVKGRVIVDYSTSFHAPISLYLTLNEFKKSRFYSYSEVNTKSDHSSNMLASVLNKIAKDSSGNAGITTLYKPSASDAQALFEELFKKSFKENILVLSKHLKEDRAFVVTAPLESVVGKSAAVNLGVQEDIRVDHPIKVLRVEDDVERVVGYMKVTNVGKNCLLLPKEERSLSKVTTIIGSVEEADLAIEHPWSGVFGVIHTEYNPATFTNSVIGETQSGATQLFAMSMSADLGYVMNRSAMSEIWMNFGIGFGRGSYSTLPSYRANGYTFTPKQESAIALKVNFALEKRYNFIRGVYLGALLDIDYELQSYAYKSSSADGSLYLSTLSVVPQMKIGYMFSPDIDIFVSLGYDTPLSTSNDFTSDATDFTLDDSYKKASGVDVRFGLNVALDFSGPFAGLFTKPSLQCNRLKKDLKKEMAGYLK